MMASLFSRAIVACIVGGIFPILLFYGEFAACQDSGVSQEQLRTVLNAVGDALDADYYDKDARARWKDIEVDYKSQIHAVDTKQQALTLIRRMLSQLRNSHILFYSVEEWNVRQNVLPFHFRKIESHVFVTDPFATAELRYGDEIISVDGRPAVFLRQRNLAKLDNVYDNPLYGKEEKADLVVARGGKRFVARVKRVPYDSESARLDELGPGVTRLTLRTLPNSNETDDLRTLWAKAILYPAIILDLRDCGGGRPSHQWISPNLAAGP